MMLIKKSLLLLLILTFPLFTQGCWQIAAFTPAFGHIEKKEKEKDEIKQAQTHERYKRINERRAKQGLPPIEDIPEYQREKSTLLY